MTECNKCGNCCENIYLSATKETLRKALKDPETSENKLADARFILKHWKADQRSKREGRRYLFSCDQFNAETRLCEAHDDRPPVCSNFPWYGEEPSMKKAKGLNSHCEFWRDVPEENWPVRVELKRKVLV